MRAAAANPQNRLIGSDTNLRNKGASAKRPSRKTAVPLKLYFKNGVAKVELSLAKGKKLHDKRETIKRREADREIQKAMKTNFK